jgi:predicted HTH transcriptional regulator
MTQPSFQFDVPRSRRTDPESSRRAEDQLRRSGVLRGQQKIALELVKAHPGKTSKQLARLGTLDRYQLARRLPELLEMKLVTRTETGNLDCQWWAK